MLKSLVDKQFIADSPYIDNTYLFILRELMPQFGNEHMQASGIEKTVVSPKFEQDILRVDHLIPVLAKPFQDFRFTMREFLSRSCV